MKILPTSERCINVVCTQGYGTGVEGSREEVAESLSARQTGERRVKR